MSSQGGLGGLNFSLRSHGGTAEKRGAQAVQFCRVRTLGITLRLQISLGLKPYFDSPRLDLTVFGLRPNKSKTIRQKNLKKIKFYHVGLVNILLNSHKAEKITIS